MKGHLHNHLTPITSENTGTIINLPIVVELEQGII